MKSVLLYEIPIYSSTEEKYNQKLKKNIEKIVYECISNGWENEKISPVIKNQHEDFFIWKYNNIVGYINITINKSDIFLELYKSDCERYVAFTKTKHYFKKMYLNGMHFRIDRFDSSVEINEEIMKYIVEIMNNHLRKNTHIDLESFHTLSRFIDYKDISNCI
ncbi:hypothetical protein [Fusibacter bizertensis]